MENPLIGFALLFVALFIVILVHEFGHLVAFRRVGMEVDTLAVGLPWGPHLSIKSEFLRRYAGPKFTLVLSPLAFVGYVKPSNSEQEEKLRDDEKALVYGGGVIANILLSIFILTVVIAMMVWKKGGIIVSSIPLVDGLPTLVIIPVLCLSALLILRFARFICLYIFLMMGALVFAFLLSVLWQMSNNVGVLADGGSYNQKRTSNGTLFL
jgi:membrane-associated protease RseP (regulator of RpoE activity)